MLKFVEPRLEDFEELSRLIWKSFYYAEKDDIGIQGMEHFRDLTEVPVLQYEYLMGNVRFLCADWEGDIVGVIGWCGDRIALLFLKVDYQRKGFGSELLKRALQLMGGSAVSVNSGLSAVGFYQKLGFTIVGEEIDEQGLRYLPMQAERRKLLKKLEKTVP